MFGLGYVGCVSLGCLAELGNTVIGVDVSNHKVDLINEGKPTIIEKDIDVLIDRHKKAGKISATTDFIQAVESSDITFICVGTPSLPTGQLNMEYVFNAARQIAEGLKSKESFHVVAIRSTVFPGTNRRVAEIIAEQAGKTENIDFAVVSNPEFLREGSAVEDYFNPSITVIGSNNARATEIMSGIYNKIDAPLIVSSIQAAEIIKYVNNTFHALKITFANEVGNICKALNIDPYEVMKLFKMDNRLNISTAYFNPGMAYGGSCLPKDLLGLLTIAHDNYVKAPVISSIAESNLNQLQRALELVMNTGHKKIGLLGLAFKKGTDDLRYSPLVSLVESLIGKGYQVSIYDRFVNISNLTGTNKKYIDQHLPHITALLKDNLKEVIEQSETLVIGHTPDESDYELIAQFDGVIVDLVRLKAEKLHGKSIIGINW